MEDYKGARPPQSEHRYPSSRSRSRWVHISVLTMLSAVFAFLALHLLHFTAAQTSVDSYIATESPIAKANLLANIGPDGSKSQGAKAGIGQTLFLLVLSLVLCCWHAQSSRHRARSTRTISTRGRATQVLSSRVSSARSIAGHMAYIRLSSPY